jgi:cell division protein ZapA
VDSRLTVEIYGRRFELRATEEGQRVQELARFVDQRMRQLAEVSPHVDTARLAVLTALNIADELFRELEKEPGTRSEQVRQRVDGLVARLDDVLAPV